MQDIINFLEGHWELLLQILLIIVSSVLFALRKKPTSDIYSKLFSYCLEAIEVAEGTQYKGDAKLDYAVGIVYKLLLAEFPKINVTEYRSCIKSIIEKILASPSKK